MKFPREMEKRIGYQTASPPDDGADFVRRAVTMASYTRLARAAAIAVMAGAVVILTAAASYAVAKDVVAAPADLKSVIDNLRNWLIGLLVGLATLCLTVGGIRYLLAAGDPGEVNKAKETLKYAAVGYGVAALAPGLVEVLKQIVGA